MTRNCKVIAIFFGKRHKPPTCGSEMLKHLDLILQKEKEVDPGVDMDTVIVNNDAGFVPGNEALDAVDGMETKRGHIRVLHRENVGISFGAFSHAFGTLRDEYDYWFFTEEDVVPIVDNYYLKCKERLDEDDNLAYVGVCGLSKSKGKLHCQGGIGLSHVKYLGEIFDERNQLPHVNSVPDVGSWKQAVKPHVMGGEIEFTNCLVRKGYRILDVELGTKTVNELPHMYHSPVVLHRQVWKMYK